MSFTPNNLKKGVLFALDGEAYESLEYQQVVKGRQQASVTVKARHLKTNKIIRYTFKGGEDLSPVDLDKRTVQFLYRDGDSLHFMEPTDFTQHIMSLASLSGKEVYLVEEQRVLMLFLDGDPLVLEMPKNVWLKVEFAPEVVKGDTTSAIAKEVRLETGLIVKTPAFIKVGDIISVDTATGMYRTRQK